ncbi:Dipeptide-binding ABC transporter [Minicystis rosea]|nr:Dipeptide-binding ABC transporter [Minicystis rosea]
MTLWLLFALGCQGSVISPAGGSGGDSATGSSSSGGGGGNGGSAGVGGKDAGGPMCQDELLADGTIGTESCNCPCGMEAPANLMLIAQAAITAFQSKGALCESSKPVPFLPPAGTCFQPNHQFQLDQDFFSGSPVSGFACLGVGPALTKPIRCQYQYHAGSGYLAPALGGPDPGPMGFEVTARGDVDDDGVFSTFSIAGTLDPMSGQFSLSPVFQHDPQE